MEHSAKTSTRSILTFLQKTVGEEMEYIHTRSLLGTPDTSTTHVTTHHHQNNEMRPLKSREHAGHPHQNEENWPVRLKHARDVPNIRTREGVQSVLYNTRNHEPPPPCRLVYWFFCRLAVLSTITSMVVINYSYIWDFASVSVLEGSDSPWLNREFHISHVMTTIS